MKKNILLLTLVLLFVGCSQKTVEKKEPVAKVKKEVKKEVKNESVPADFVPEHIRLSHIEVVEH
jgi:Tfp pilus assembly protein PilP